MAGIIAFLSLGRPLHLVGGLIFHILGLAVAHYLGYAIDWTTAAWGQLAITAIQLCTHYGNDYFDLEADRASVNIRRWSGGSRVLPDGLLPAWVALVASLAFAAIAVAASLHLSFLSANPILTLSLFLLSLILAWSYSGPPLYLNRRGLGELSGAVLVPGLTTLVGFELQAGRLDRLPMLVAVPLCCFQFAMLLVVGLPDAAGDLRASKRTLVVQVGGARAAKLTVVAILAGYASLPVLFWLGLPVRAAAGVLVTLPFGAAQMWRLANEAWQQQADWDGLGFWAIGILLMAALAEALALAIGR